MEKIQVPELLAPAGSLDALKAAVNAGADAVSACASGASGGNGAHLFNCREVARGSGLREPQAGPLADARVSGGRRLAWSRGGIAAAESLQCEAK